MRRILVVLHIYYHDQVDYFIEKFANINSCEWDLLVTYSEHNEITEAKIRKIKADARFIKVRNVGYDVWPFICALKGLDLSSYDYIMKLHTKNFQTESWKMNGLNLKGDMWRDLLVDSILKSPMRFYMALKMFEADHRIGMICSRELLVRPGNKHPEDTYLLSEEAERIGITKVFEPFCAGTMFIVRACCLDRILKADLDEDIWDPVSSTRSGGSAAHVYERLFGSAVADSGYRVKGIRAYYKTGLKVKLHTVVSPILKKIFSMDYGEDGKKALVILGLKIHSFKSDN